MEDLALLEYFRSKFRPWETPAPSVLTLKWSCLLFFLTEIVRRELPQGLASVSAHFPASWELPALRLLWVGCAHTPPLVHRVRPLRSAHWRGSRGPFSLVPHQFPPFSCSIFISIKTPFLSKTATDLDCVSPPTTTQFLFSFFSKIHWKNWTYWLFSIPLFHFLTHSDVLYHSTKTAH